MKLLSNIIADNKFTAVDLESFTQKLFFEGAQRRLQLERFIVLMVLSTIIATFGVLADSTATVIGAMLIAPLMTPIMAMAAALVMGDMQRVSASFAIVVTGVVLAVGLAWLIGHTHIVVISFTANSQITSRVSPSLTDLAIALASGVAGAFAMSRSDVADSLPGVAIAIALVPPLAVVGIALSQEQWEDALGAMLLFLTNFVSILLAGGGTLALLGLSAAHTKGMKSSARRKAFMYIAIGALLVTIPLTATTFRVARDSIAELETHRATEAWLAESDFEVTRINANGDQIRIIITGLGEPPPLSALGSEVQAALGPGYMLQLQVVPSQQVFYPELTANR